MRTTARALLATAVLAAGATAVATAGPAAATSSHWARARTATIHPGVTINVVGVKCAAGYVLAAGRRVFLALPASCTGVSYGDPVNGCTEAQVPPGQPVDIQGARHPGKVVYSSFTRMQLLGATGNNRCHNNNLSLVQVNRHDIKRVNPSIPVMGGPDGVSHAQPASPDRLEVLLAGAPTGAQAVSSGSGGWAHSMVVDGQVARQSVGSPVLTPSGRALGMISVIPFQGGPGETTVTDLSRELTALRNTPHFHHAHLVRGTRAFSVSSGAGLPLG